MPTVKLDIETFEEMAYKLAEKIKKEGKEYENIYPVPRGGYLLGIILADSLKLPVAGCKEVITNKTLIVDDLIDSGKTLSEFKDNDKAVLYVKHGKKKLATYYLRETDAWIKFPDEKDDEVQDHITRIMQYIGEDTQREGLLETPKRVQRAIDEIFSGYKQNPKDLMKTFTQGTCKEMVILKNCEFYSTCEHHMFPFFGHISIGYLPNKKVIGISKLARLVDLYSKRMQIQERMTAQIADTIMKELDAKGVYVVCEGVHFCMRSRGVKKQDASMITSAVRGTFLKDAKARQEFLTLIKS